MTILVSMRTVMVFDILNQVPRFIDQLLNKRKNKILYSKTVHSWHWWIHNREITFRANSICLRELAISLFSLSSFQRVRNVLISPGIEGSGEPSHLIYLAHLTLKWISNYWKSGSWINSHFNYLRLDSFIFNIVVQSRIELIH